MTDMAEKHLTVPLWARACLYIQDKCIYEAFGPRILKVAWVINFHKFFTIFLIYGMMVWYENFSNAAWVYLALHGFYGFCWLVKDFGFRDHQFNTKVSFLGGILTYVILIGWYWVIPWLYISRAVEPSGIILFAAIGLHMLGITFMIAGDGQRHFVLKHHKGLIKDGMFRYTRNPNYLGEVMIYSSYAWLANHWMAWAVVSYAVVTAFFPRMMRKDVSISRHHGWDDYRINSGLLIPWAFFNGRALRDLFQREKNNE